jgi:prevent-host-death family protein
MPPEEIGVFEAKTRLSELLDRVREGRVYRITKRGKPVAELRPIRDAGRRPRFAADRGRLVIRADFEAPIPEFDAYRK